MVKFNGQVGEWLIPADCKSAASGYDGSNPSLSTNHLGSRVVSRTNSGLGFDKILSGANFLLFVQLVVG